MSKTSESLTVFSDYVCPFCYLGRQSLETYQDTRDSELAIDWKPFDLRSQKRQADGSIDFTVDDGKDEEYYDNVRENVARLREEYDAEEMLELDAIPDEIDSLNAQLTSLYVQSEHPDRWEAFDAAIFEALWVQGKNIESEEVLVEIAADVGVDAEEIRSVLTNSAYRDQLQDEFADARQLGITGVPTFVYGEYIARGAVPPEHLERLVEGQ
jgi:predicted DsbA family dithiol-disulfide isomerase